MGLRRLIQRNFWAKFLSFVLAFLVWLSIQTSQVDDAKAEQDGKIPVSEETKPTLPLPKAPTGLAAAQPKPATSAVVNSDPFTRSVAILKPPGDGYAYEVKPPEVELVVQGEKESLTAMDKSDIRVFVDISEVLERFGSSEQHVGIPVRIDVHTPTTVGLASVTPTLATVKRIPPRAPRVKPPPPKPEVIEMLEKAEQAEKTPPTNAAPTLFLSTNTVSQPEPPEATDEADKETQPNQNSDRESGDQPDSDAPPSREPGEQDE